VISQPAETPPATEDAKAATLDSSREPSALRRRLASYSVWTIVRERVLPFIASIAVVALIIKLFGADPATAFSALIDGAFGNQFGIADLLVFASILILTGFAAAIPFSAGMWNIGGEGQLYAGAIGSTAAAFAMPGSVPHWAGATLCIVAGILAGAFWGFLAGYPRTRWGANEVIVTLMLTYIALYLADYAIGLWPSQSNTTRDIPSNTALASLWAGTSLNAGVFLGVIAMVGGWFLMFRTGLGFQIRAVGQNVRNAELNGVKPGSIQLTAFVIGGAFAGAAGSILVLGVNQALVSNLSDNLGYLGIAVALMGGLSPLGILASAFLFSTLRAGGDSMQVATNLDPAVGDVIVSAFVITLLAFHAIRVQQLSSVRE
jgi:general nucleoside transport system permease protein